MFLITKKKKSGRGDPARGRQALTTESMDCNAAFIQQLKKNYVSLRVKNIPPPRKSYSQPLLYAARSRTELSGCWTPGPPDSGGLHPIPSPSPAARAPALPPLTADRTCFSRGPAQPSPPSPRALLIWGQHSGRGTLVQRSLEGSHPLCSPLHPCRLQQARTALIVKHSVSLALGQRRVLSRCRLLSTCMRYMPRVRPCALTNEGALFCAPLLRPPSQIHA